MKCEGCKQDVDELIISTDNKVYCFACANGMEIIGKINDMGMTGPIGPPSIKETKNPMIEIQVRTKCTDCNGTLVVGYLKEPNGVTVTKACDCDNGYRYKWINLSELKNELAWV